MNNKANKTKRTNPKVSIIMPSFNVAPYIRECMDSVINQTLRDIEIIVVDAFSTDGTREILEEYATRDDRITILDDDKGSTGYAFNKGVRHSNGEYIGLVETDDYIEFDMMETLYGLAEKNELDYIKADFRVFLDVSNERIQIPMETFYHEDKRLYGEIIIPRKHENVRISDGYMWKGLYLKSFLINNDITMHETKGASFQDQGFLYKAAYSANRAMYINKYFYHYRRDNSSSSVYSANMLDKMMTEYKLIEQDIQIGNLDISNNKYEYYYEKYARYRDIILKIPEEQWRGYAEKIRMEFLLPFEQGYIKPYSKSEAMYEEVIALINSTEEYSQMLLSDKGKWYEQIKNIMTFADENEIIICSAGRLAWGLYCLLRRVSKASVIAVADNSRDVQGQIINGFKIISVTEVVKNKNVRFIIVNATAYQDIYAQLRKLGIKNNDIYICNHLDIYKATDINLKAIISSGI